MKFIKFTTFKYEHTIKINPLDVVAIEQHTDKSTNIHLFSGTVISVKGLLDETEKLLLDLE